jgi:hypothetical protein
MASPEEKIAQVAPSLLFRVNNCHATDPAVEFAIERGDPAQRARLIAVTLETTANTYRMLAEGAQKAADIVSGKS